jgi:bacterial mobilisation protein (mobC)./ribbon-helix-helix protein, copG family
MRKRNVHVQFWLDKKEAEAFNKKVKRSGLSREVYLRHLINGLVTAMSILVIHSTHELHQLKKVLLLLRGDMTTYRHYHSN